MRYFLLAILIFTSFFVSAQVEVSFRQIEKGVSYLNAWDLLLRNNGNEKLVVLLETVITSRESGKVYEARTEKFLLVPGTQFVSRENLPGISTIFVLPDDNLLFKNENYDIQVRLLDYPGLNELAIANYNYVYNKIEDLQDSIQQKKKVTFGLSANFNGQYQNVFNDTLQTYPNYARLNVVPTLSVFDIPVTGELFLSTDNPEGLFRGTDHYNVKFDYQQFKTILIQKAYEKLNAIAGQKIPVNLSDIDKINKDYWRKVIPDFDTLSKLLDDPNIMEQLNILKNQEAFKQILDNPEIKSKIKKLEEIRDNYGLTPDNFKKVSDIFKDFQPDKLEELLSFIPRDSLPFDIKSDNMDTVINKLQKFVATGEYKKWLDKSSLTENAIGLTDKIAGLNKIKSTLKIEDWQDLKDIDKVVDNFSLDDIRQIGDLEKQIDEIEQLIGMKDIDIKQLDKLMDYSGELKKYKNVPFEELLNDPSSLKDLDNVFSLLSKKEKILNSFKNIEVGKIYPEFTPMTLEGNRLTGGLITFDNEKIFISTVAGKSDILTSFLNDSISSIGQDSVTKRSIFGVSGGWGSPKENFVHINYLASPYTINPANIELADEKGVAHVASLNFGMNLFKSAYILYGEVAKSFDKSQGFGIPEMAGKINFSTKIKRLKLKWESGVEFIGKNYSAFGLPFSIKDRLTFETGIQQTLLKNQLTLQVRYKEDQFEVSTASPRYFRAVLTSIAFSKPKFPYIQLVYQPIINSEVILNRPSRNFYSNIQANAAYTFVTGNINHNIQMTYNNILNRNFRSQTITGGNVELEYLQFGYEKVHQAGFRYVIKSKKNMGFQQSFNMTLPNQADIERIFFEELSANFSVLKKSKNTIGLQYANGSINGDRLGFFLQSTFPVTKYLNVEFRVQNDALRLIRENETVWRNGLLIKGTLGIKL
ncbi:MAG: hypothetical protein K1X55_04755 [Chitinophagales bacterium]|nr:hypothetical protein [Chitinophagales bacterium]